MRKWINCIVETDSQAGNIYINTYEYLGDG